MDLIPLGSFPEFLLLPTLAKNTRVPLGKFVQGEENKFSFSLNYGSVMSALSSLGHFAHGCPAQGLEPGIYQASIKLLREKTHP